MDQSLTAEEFATLISKMVEEGRLTYVWSCSCKTGQGHPCKLTMPCRHHAGQEPIAEREACLILLPKHGEKEEPNEKIRCRGKNLNGDQCKNSCDKEEGACAVHRGRAQVDVPDLVPVKRGTTATTGTSTEGICRATFKKNGLPCTHKAKANGLCGIHKNC